MQKEQAKGPLKLYISEHSGLIESKGRRLFRAALGLFGAFLLIVMLAAIFTDLGKVWMNVGVIAVLMVGFLIMTRQYLVWARKDIQMLQKQYQDCKEQNAAIMRGVMSAMHSHVVVLDRECQKVLFSNLGYNNVGYVTEGENGEKILDVEKLYNSVNNKAALDEIFDCLYNQRPCNVEKELEFANGKKGWYRLKIEQLMEEDNLVGNLLVVKNITEEHERRDALLAATDKQKKAFMALSHEFRTPINAISGSIDMLSLSENLNAKEKSHIRNIKQAYKGLLSVVSKATDYTSLQDGELTIEKKEFTIYDLLDNIRTLTHIRAYEKGIGYCIDIAQDVPLRLIGDLDKISRVLQSFLYNAIEHTDTGCVTMHISRVKEDEKDYICYGVSDTGEGIKEEFIGRIFDEFIGFEMGSDEYSEGLGVSLYVSRKIIELMGGKAECRSQYGEGSTFAFKMELETPDDKPIVTIDKPETMAILLCTDIEWKKEYIRRVCEALHIPVLRTYDEADIVNDRFTHVIIDSQHPEASMLLEEEFHSGKKVLVLESSRDKIDGTSRADFIIYEPFTIMMFAEMLSGDNANKEDTEGIDKVGELVFQLKGVKALVVDDNAVNLMVASNVLMQYGIEVEEADSGSMAVKKYYENDDYDIIFMDYLMPDMNGVETIRNIRNLKREKETILIALSANVTEDIVAEFNAVGAHHVMAKPLELKELSEVLKKYLPEEKFARDEQPVSEEKNSQPWLDAAVDKEDVKSILHNVKGLNVERGLANVMGVTETYVKVLNVCCTNITEQIEYIKAAYRLVALGGLKIYFHSLKGILANIGAIELSDFSKEMEIASRDQNEAYIKENVASYIQQIETFRDNLKWAIEEYKKLTEADTLETTKSMKSKDYQEKLEQLLICIKRFEFNEINTLIEELIQASKDERKDTLKEAYNYIQQFQYDEALELVEKLKK